MMTWQEWLDSREAKRAVLRRYGVDAPSRRATSFNSAERFMRQAFGGDRIPQFANVERKGRKVAQMYCRKAALADARAGGNTSAHDMADKECCMHPLYEKADRLTNEVIGAAIEVQKHFGIGLLESVYAKCLACELEMRGHEVKTEFPVAIRYKGYEFTEKLRVDLLVDDCLVIEVKARHVKDKELDAFNAQALTYITLLNLPLALVINFNAEYVGKYGVSRVILKGADAEGLDECAKARASARASFGASSEPNFASFASKMSEVPPGMVRDVALPGYHVPEV